MAEPTAQELRDQAAALLKRSVELDTPLTADDLDKMFKQRRYEEIEQARQNGRFDGLLNPPTQEERNRNV